MNNEENTSDKNGNEEKSIPLFKSGAEKRFLDHTHKLICDLVYTKLGVRGDIPLLPLIEQQLRLELDRTLISAVLSELYKELGVKPGTHTDQSIVRSLTQCLLNELLIELPEDTSKEAKESLMIKLLVIVSEACPKHRKAFFASEGYVQQIN